MMGKPWVWEAFTPDEEWEFMARCSSRQEAENLVLQDGIADGTDRIINTTTGEVWTPRVVWEVGMPKGIGWNEFHKWREAFHEMTSRKRPFRVEGRSSHTGAGKAKWMSMYRYFASPSRAIYCAGQLKEKRNPWCAFRIVNRETGEVVWRSDDG